jgi:antitoxin component HigA of HigAB toxin-antitoxin module
MGKSEIAEMKARAKGIIDRAKKWAETPEGRDHELRLEFSRNLAKALKTRKLTNQAFCDRIGMKHPQFSRIIQGDENITLAMVRRIADGLGVHSSRLFQKPRKTRETAGAK